MHAKIARRTLRFGGVTPAGAEFWCGVPGPADVGGAAFARGDAAALIASGFLPVNTADQSAVRLDLTGGGGPITAIGISPDSAIHTADIALVGRNGETERHRISPGNPLLGCRDDEDWALVTVPNSIPGVADSATVLNFDATGIGTNNAFGFPLRLEIWRGGILPMRSPKRAGYFAHGLFEIAAAASRTFRVCVDGRRKVDVFAWSSAGTSTISCNAVEARKVTAAPTKDNMVQQALELTSAGALSVVAAGQTISFDGNPMTIIEVVIAQTVATGIVQIKVKAWD